MKRFKLYFLFTLIVNASFSQSNNWTSSTIQEVWKQSTVKAIEVKTNDKDANVIIYSDRKLQEIDGFGGCFNELGWDALTYLASTEREKIMQELFSANASNFTICRTPIGASDYAMSYYSLNDVADDFNMRNFNIDRDRYILVPYIKEAQKIKPDLEIWGSPWCPPYWMKSNFHYASKVEAEGQKNDLSPQKISIAQSTGFKMQEGYLKAYALYFDKYITAYKREGITISAVHVQNEPLAQQSFPSCTWRSEDLSYFLGHYLGPQLKKTNPDVDIWFGTINNGDPNYIRKALNDTIANKYIKGVGFQWDGKNAIPFISKEFPKTRLMQTESECGNGSNDWKAAEYTWSLINHYLLNGANSYLYWNMVLDNKGESRWGWVQNSLISIDKKSKKVVYNPEFYLMKHLSHFVKQGAYRVDTNGGNDHLAFVNPDGEVILLYVNVTKEDKIIKVMVKNKLLTTTIKANSFNTFNF